MKTTTLIYTSKANQQVTAGSVKELASISARNNAQIGVTGILLYGCGNYFQVLEGNQASVRILYERIRKDPRHYDCELLLEYERKDRLFPDWNMGQLNLEEADILGSDWDLICSTLAHAGAVDWEQSDPVLGWIRQFMSHNRGGASSAA